MGISKQHRHSIIDRVQIIEKEYTMTKPYAITTVLLMILTGSCAPCSVGCQTAKAPGQRCTVDQIQSISATPVSTRCSKTSWETSPHPCPLCSGGQMLCCTYDNTTNQIQTCRKPAGSAFMPGVQGSVACSAVPASSGVASTRTPQLDEEEAPIPNG